MKDLNTPLKTPFISVFNRAGERIADNFGLGDITVVSVRYKFDDEDDDICTIKMQMSDPEALDLLNIKRGTELRVVWGYLNNIASPPATVVVRDMTSDYGPNVIYTDLECTDYLTYLKIFRSAEIDALSLIDYISSLRYGKYNIKIKDRNKTIYWQYRRDKEDEERFREFIQKLENIQAYTILDFVETPSNDVIAGLWAEDIIPDDPVKEYFEKEDINIVTAGKSQFVVIQDLLKKCPNGPWFVTGRGNWLIIHNRNLSGSINRSYKYNDENGQLISFKAKTKFENFERQSISYAGMDGSDRKNFFVDDYRKALLNQRSIKEILEDKEITVDEKKKEVKGFIDLYKGGYTTFRTKKTEGGFVKHGDDYYFVYGRYDSPILKTEVDGYAVRDQTNVSFDQMPPGMFPPDNTGKIDIEQEILRAAWYTFPLLSYDEMVNVTTNRERELAQQKEEGKMIVEGDPYLQDQQRIAIYNVHSQHEGIYYIKKCEHIITASGYKTELDCLKVTSDATINTLGTITQETFEEGELTDEQLKIYKREQMLYGYDVVVSSEKYIGERHFVQTDANFAEPVISEYEGLTIRFSDLFNDKYKYTTETWVDKLFEVYEGKDPDIDSIKLDPENK